MTVRTIALALAGTAAFALAPATPAAHADSWRFMGQYRTLSACRLAGAYYVAHRQAHLYKCENDYTQSGDPALDLYLS